MPPRNPELYGQDGFPTETALEMAINVVTERSKGQLVPPEASDIIFYFAERGHPDARICLGMEPI